LGYRYLHSRQVVDEVAAHIEAKLGTPTRIAQATIGVDQSSLEGLQLFEPGSHDSSEPWAEVEHLDIDGSLWKLLEKKAVPRQMTLKGVTVTLRLDPKGQALTRLPDADDVFAALPGN